MAKDKDGNRLFRRVQIRIYFPDNIFPIKNLVQRAPAHKGFNDDGITDLLMQVGEQLETLYPFWEFKPVELSPVGGTSRWALTFAGYNAKAVNPNPTVPSLPEQTVTEFTGGQLPEENKDLTPTEVV